MKLLKCSYHGFGFLIESYHWKHNLCHFDLVSLYTPNLFVYFILEKILHNIDISHRCLAWVVWDFFLMLNGGKFFVCHSSSKQKQHLSESFPVTLCLLLFIWHCCETFGTLQLHIKHLLGRLGLLFLWWIQHMWRRVVGHILILSYMPGELSSSDLKMYKYSSLCPCKRAAPNSVFLKLFSFRSEQNNELLLLSKYCC